MTTRSHRVAVIGYGLAGSAFHAPLINVTPGLELAAIVTSNPERQKEARGRYPNVELLPSIDEIMHHPDRFDSVVVASPNRTHVPLARALIRAGIATVVDKPMAMSSRDAEGLMTEARSRGLPLTVFQNRRWDGDFLTVQALLQRGLLGTITRFESRYERYRPEPRKGVWRESADPEDAGGLLYDLGSHLIDQALVLFGRPRSVYAEVRVRRADAAVDDDSFVALTFPSGVDAHLWVSSITPLPGPRFRLEGLQGGYEKYGMDPQEAFLRAGAEPGGDDWGKEAEDAWGRLVSHADDLHLEGHVETLPGDYRQFYARWSEALAGDGPVPVVPEDAVATLRVIEAAQQSSKAGEVVEIPL